MRFISPSAWPAVLTVAEIKRLLQARHLRLTKSLGQHHLIDSRRVRQIIDACELSPGDAVVEIGAGLGALTEPLAEAAGRVLAVEIDRGICPLLAERMARWPHVRVACQDLLTLEDREVDGAVVVGAIPYHITSQIVAWLTERRERIRRAILIVQREVAARLAAAPGTKTYGRLSVLAQYGWQVRELFTVPRSAFFPQPEVDSACVRLLPRPQPAITVAQERHFFAVVKAAFSQRRKTLANCLSNASEFGLSRPQAQHLLESLGHPPAVRGEQLSLEQFASLANALVH